MISYSQKKLKEMKEYENSSLIMNDSCSLNKSSGVRKVVNQNFAAYYKSF